MMKTSPTLKVNTSRPTFSLSPSLPLSPSLSILISKLWFWSEFIFAVEWIDVFFIIATNTHISNAFYLCYLVSDILVIMTFKESEVDDEDEPSEETSRNIDPSTTPPHITHIIKRKSDKSIAPSAISESSERLKKSSSLRVLGTNSIKRFTIEYCRDE
jgi:hypothetical protein